MGALSGYMQQAQRLIGDTRQADTNPDDLISYINEARLQVAAEGAAVRVLVTQAITAGNRGPYPFAGFTLPGGTGVQAVLNARQATYIVGGGQKWIAPREYEWFTLYELNQRTPRTGPPEFWSQYAQGETGSLYVSPVPDVGYTLILDCVGVPIPLVDDATVEAIPVPWTSAVAYFAAYLAQLARPGRGDDAGRMLQMYEMFTARARKMATPDVLPGQYPRTSTAMPAPVRGVVNG